VKDSEKDMPDAILSIGPAAFGIWITRRGLRKLTLPEVETVMNGRKKYPASVNIKRNLGPGESRLLADTATFLESMFRGGPPEDHPSVDVDGMSDFTRSVLEAAMEIPWGETRSYGWIANKIGKPDATRAVGQALGRNPVLLVIPCHRVIREDGSLGGYGQGIDWKKGLLSLERGEKEL
jgi:O-6-methylguanine DNA methyltransferase